MPTGVVTFLSDSPAAAAIYESIVRHLRHDTSGEHEVRVGLILSIAEDRIGAEQTPYDSNSGRGIARTTTKRRPERERRHLAIALTDATQLVDHVGITAMKLAYETWECISVSGLSDASAEVLAERVGPKAFACLRFNGWATESRYYFWDALIPVDLFASGRHVTSYEGAPTGFGEVDGQTYFIPDSDRRPHNGADGYFADIMGYVLLEESFAHVSPPRPPSWSGLPPVRASPPSRTPAAHVLGLLGRSPTARISSMDDPAQPAIVRLAEAIDQFAEPELVRAKLHAYCLDPDDEERKWIGFALAGYNRSDASLLANLLCSALFEGFTPIDVRGTADGATQFSVNVALPRRFGGVEQCETAWVVQPNGPIKLATAYVTGGREGNAVTLLPHDLDTRPDSSDLVTYVSQEADRFGVRSMASPLQAAGWLWISKSDPISNRFALHVRRTEAAITVARQGRRWTQWSPGLSITGATQVAAGLRKAQNLLGLVGIESRAESRWD